MATLIKQHIQYSRTMYVVLPVPRHIVLVILDLFTEQLQLFFLLVSLLPLLKLGGLIIKDNQVSSTHIESTEVIHSGFGVKYIFVHDKGRPPRVLVLVSQANLVDSSVFSKDCVELISCNIEWEIANEQDAIDFGGKARQLGGSDVSLAVVERRTIQEYPAESKMWMEVNLEYLRERKWT